MSDEPPSISEHPNTPNNTSPDRDPSCPFCTITNTFNVLSPLDPTHELFEPSRLDPPTYVLLSTPHVVAFLDIAPLTRGHVLVAPRHHRIKIGDLSSAEASEIGRVLPLVARAVLAATFPDIPHNEVDYNVVQNNGPGAAQVIPHVHFHVIPRPPLGYQRPVNGTGNGSGKSAYAQAKVPTGLKASYVQFGRGQRNELDEDDAEVLVREIRDRVKAEWEREFGRTVEVPTRKEHKL